MSERAREDWGALFRRAVANGRSSAFGVLAVAFFFVATTEGLAQVFSVIVGLVALVGAFPKSPLIPAIVQWLPKLPSKGDAS